MQYHPFGYDRSICLSPVLVIFTVWFTIGCGPGTSPQPDTGPSGPKIADFAITQNPNNVLSAYVDLEVSPAAKVTLQVKQGGETVQRVGPSDKAKSHSLDVLGLYADTSYKFVATAEAEGQTKTETKAYETDPLPDNFPPLEVKTAKPDKAADGIRMMSLYRWEKPGEGHGYQTGWGMIVGIDETGKVVWYHKADHWTWNAHRISNGNLVYIIADHRIVEIDMMGNVVSEWGSKEDFGLQPSDNTYGIHHSVVEQEDGTFVSLSTQLQRVDGYLEGGGEANVIGDLAFEFNREGDVLETWSMFDILSDYTTRRRFGTGGAKWDDEYGKKTEDWSHANALNLGDEPGTLIASLRHQDWVVKWDRETGELLWRLGPEGDFAFPDGSDGEFNYHQHAPNWTEDGNLLVYDNGNFRESVEPGERFYTRVVEYSLDTSNLSIEQGTKGRVEQVWVAKRPPKYHAPHVGDAETVPNGNVLISDGGLLENPEKCYSFDDNGELNNKIWDCIASPDNLNWARLVEVTHDEKKEQVMEVWIKDTSKEKPRGYTMYRVDFLDSLYPDGSDDTK